MSTQISESSSASGKRDYWRRVARIGAQVAEAVHYAHGEGVLHRDIKSANLLLDDQGRVWVTDFGLATVAAQERLSRSDDIVGTLRYMAPEQLNGQCDARSDIYSLGLTIYELLVMRPAFDEVDRDRLIDRVSKADLIPPRKLCPDTPRDLETIVLKATAVDPNHRYQTASDLADDLQRFLDYHVIRARRAGPVERLWRWSRRNPVIASLSAVLLLVAITSFTAISWKWREAEIEKQRAERENQRAEANLSLALDSMDQILGSWATSWMAHPADPQNAEGEDEIGSRVVVSGSMAETLKDALKFYDQFAVQNAHNPRLQRDTAEAHRRVGEIYERLGQYAEAENAFRQAARILDGQRRLFPNDTNLLTTAAATRNQLGGVLSVVERHREARDQFHLAEKVLRSQASFTGCMSASMPLRTCANTP
jgi:tetratricopeptide (TPR) repeat protein